MVYGVSTITSEAAPGGSHDRTDLLPLKAGVAVIALEAHGGGRPVEPTEVGSMRMAMGIPLGLPWGISGM